MSGHAVDAAVHAPGEKRAPQLRPWLGALLLLPVPALVYAAWRYELLANVGPEYLQMLLIATLGVLVSAGVAWALLRTRGGSAVAASVAAVFVTAGFVAYAGAAAAWATLLLTLCAMAAGAAVDRQALASPWLRLLAGLAIVAALVGWLLPFPIHDSRVYVLVAGVVALLARNTIIRDWRLMAADWGRLSVSHPFWLILVVLAFGVASLGLWLPGFNADDNAVHLLLPDQLLAVGYYRLDVSSQLWAVAPWSSNVLHGVAALLAGEEVRPAVNVLWLLLGASGAFRLARALQASPAVSLAAAAVYCSHPMTALFATSMQVDSIGAVVVLHLAAELVLARGRMPSPWITGVLFGLLAGLKASNVIYALLPLAWLCWSAVRHRQLGRLATMAGVAAVVGGSSYAYATLVTGNPVFPLFNAVFQSPYMAAENFRDGRWHEGIDWRTLWDITFDSGRFMEAYAGALGIALLAVLGGVFMELVRGRASRWITAWAFVAGLLMFSQVQYLRYIFPAIAMLTTVGVVGLGQHVPGRLFAAAIVVVVAVNAMLMPTTSWVTRGDPWAVLIREGAAGKAQVQRMVTPERTLLQRLRVQEPGACILVTHSSHVGSAAGNANAMDWYDPRLSQARAWARADDTGVRWQQLLQSVEATHVLLNIQEGGSLLKALEALGYRRADHESAIEVWARQEPGTAQCSRGLQRARDQAHRLFHPGDTH